MMKDIDKKVCGIFDDALMKYREGEKKYGELDIMKDPRNFLAEAEDELLDTINYVAFEIMRIRKVNARLNKMILEARATGPHREMRIVELLAKNLKLRQERDDLLRQIAESDDMSEEVSE